MEVMTGLKLLPYMSLVQQDPKAACIFISDFSSHIMLVAIQLLIFYVCILFFTFISLTSYGYSYSTNIKIVLTNHTC